MLLLEVISGEVGPGPGSVSRAGPPWPRTRGCRWAATLGMLPWCPAAALPWSWASSGIPKEVGVTCESGQETAANHLCVLGQAAAFLPQHPYLQEEGGLREGL